MPASRIKLGHKQQFYVNGTPMAGTRELGLNVTTRQVDVTGVNSPWASSLPVAIEVEVTATLYYADELPPLYANLVSHPKTPLELSVPGIFDGKFVVTDIKAGIPMGEVVAHDVTFRVWGWQ